MPRWPSYHGVVPLLADFWRDVCGRVERRHRAGRLKQWLNYLRVAYPEAEQAFDALRAVNDPDAIGAWVLRIQELPAHVQQAPAAKITYKRTNFNRGNSPWPPAC